MEGYTSGMLRWANRVRRVAGRGARPGFLLAAAASACAQTQVRIEHEGVMRPVVAMEDRYPLVQTDDGRERVYDGRVNVVPVGFFTDGAIRVAEKDAAIGQDYGNAYGTQFFRFVANVEAERDFFDCFVLFLIEPEQGESTYVMRELPDIAAAGLQQIQITVPVNTALGGGTFAYKIYSQGEEVEIIDPERMASAPIRQESPPRGPEAPQRRALARASGSSLIGGDPSSASVTEAHMPDFPPSLVGELQGGYAEALYTIAPNGQASELLDARADHPALLLEAIKAIARSRYSPAMSQGRPRETAVRQRFFFNEFASFPEELVTVPEPSLPDREPVPVYHPLPEVQTASEVVVEIEVTVDRLGRTISARIVSAPNDAIADALAEATREWIFLPAIKDGDAVEQSVTLPVRFAP